MSKKSRHYPVTIIIPTWNSDEHLKRCLDALTAQSTSDFEVVIVDNGSREFDDEGIHTGWPKLSIRTERLAKNCGFAAACNLGAQRADGEWLAFLNADAFAEPEWLEAFIQGKQKYPNCTSFGSFLVQDGQRERMDNYGDVYHISGCAWKGGYGYPLNHAPKEPTQIFSPGAAAAFYRRDVFLEMGGFDEDFFSYWEDIDLGFRFNLRGHRCLFLPDSRVRHVTAASVGRESNFAMYHTQRNIEWVYIKNMPSLLFWLCLPLRVCADGLFFLLYLTRGKGAIFLKAKMHAVKELRKMAAKRRQIQKGRRATTGEIWRLMNKDLFAPLLQGAWLRRFYRAAGRGKV